MSETFPHNFNPYSISIPPKNFRKATEHWCEWAKPKSIVKLQALVSAAYCELLHQNERISMLYKSILFPLLKLTAVHCHDNAAFCFTFAQGWDF